MITMEMIGKIRRMHLRVNGCANSTESGDAKKAVMVFCRLGAGSRAGAARRSEPLTRRRRDTLLHGCKRGIFALTAMLTGFFRRQLLSILRRR